MILAEREVNMEENQKKPTTPHTQGEPKNDQKDHENDQKGHKDDQPKGFHKRILDEISGLPEFFGGKH